MAEASILASATMCSGGGGGSKMLPVSSFIVCSFLVRRAVLKGMALRLVTLHQSPELANVLPQPALVVVVGELQFRVVQSRPDLFEQLWIVRAAVVNLVVHHPRPTLAVGQV